jgi:hypothetical protein
VFGIENGGDRDWRPVCWFAERMGGALSASYIHVESILSHQHTASSIRSVVDRFVYTEKVIGSNPVWNNSFLLFARNFLYIASPWMSVAM